MPEVSIIVPVYNVEAYLAECLDSILGQDFADIELIAVDDCSPDGSAAILQRYAQADARVRVLSLERNVGLGHARNAGLDAASGRYVWFLDSDDSIRPGSLAAIVARAHQTDAEVVVFGWTRDYEDGRSKAGSGRFLLAEAPQTFDVAVWPKILQVLHIVWNKLIRRELLDRTGLRFIAGYYEDPPFTYPLLAAARSITAMPDAVVKYRQRAGAITKSPGDRHMELIGQWRRTYALVDELHGHDPALRAELFPLMIRQCARALLSSKRIPISRQREFVSQLRTLFSDYHPRRPYQTWNVIERVQHRLIELGSLPLLKIHSAIAILLRRIRHGPPDPGH